MEEKLAGKPKTSTVSVYFKNGNVFSYDVSSALKAREHAEKIWTSGFRTEIDGKTEWFGPHYVDKITWTNDETPLARKYGESPASARKD